MIKLVAPGVHSYARQTTTALTPPLPAGLACLFLDVDGTLVEFAATPSEVRIDLELIELLGALILKLDGALALISGRPITELDRLFDPLLLPIAGIHGLERRDFRRAMHRSISPSAALLDPVRGRLRTLVACHSGLELEDKHAALALHFRRVPQDEGLVRRAIGDVMNSLVPDFELLEGDKVFEIKPSSHNKASAVEAFMQEAPFAGRKPMYFGDDYTDRDGFAAVERHGGLAVAVGNRISSRWKLPDPAAVRRWLASFAGGQST